MNNTELANLLTELLALVAEDNVELRSRVEIAINDLNAPVAQPDSALPF